MTVVRKVMATLTVIAMTMGSVVPLCGKPLNACTHLTVLACWSLLIAKL